MKKHDIIEIEGTIHHETIAAYLFSSDEDDKKIWLPKSLCEWDGTMQLPEWLAVDKGLI